MVQLKNGLIATGLLLFVSLTSYGQNTLIKGQVIDSLTLQPLPYVNIVLKGKQIGTFTDESGEFTIEGDENDTLIVSHIGYSQSTALVSADNYIIKLKPQPDVLSEVVINASKKVEKEELGFYKQKTNMVMSGIFQYALFIENKRNRLGILEELNFKIDHSWRREKTDKRDALVRIRVYKKDALTGGPGSDIYRKDYIVTIKSRQKKLTVDVSDDQIPFLPDGIFIGIDILGFVDSSGELTNYHISDVQKYITIPVTTEYNTPFTYINPNGSGWVINKIFNPSIGRMEIANSCFGIEVLF